MYGKPWQLVFIAVVLLSINVSETHAANCASNLTRTDSVTKIINCIIEHEHAVAKAQQDADAAVKKAEALVAKLTTLENAKQSAPVVVPPGAVVAFDLKTGCPADWTDVGLNDSKRFAGRTLIAVGPRVDRNNGGTTIIRDYDDQGGEQDHTLNINEMPSHSHGPFGSAAFRHLVQLNGGSGSKIKSGPDGDILFDNPDKTKASGNGQAHNNMPPFIALYFCKKN